MQNVEREFVNLFFVFSLTWSFQYYFKLFSVNWEKGNCNLIYSVIRKADMIFPNVYVFVYTYSMARVWLRFFICSYIIDLKHSGAASRVENNRDLNFSKRLCSSVTMMQLFHSLTHYVKKILRVYNKNRGLLCNYFSA